MSGLVEAARFHTRVQADLARIYLESHGLYGVLFDADNSAYSDGAIVDVRLMVIEEELAQARELLREYEA